MQERRMSAHIDASDFSLEKSMSCGQVFGWQEQDGAYHGMIGASAASIRQEAGRISFVSECGLTPSDIVGYLGLDQDLQAILRSITRDSFMREVVASVSGLRLLRQDPWPCLCSYIISANNRVERIDRIVKDLSRKFGERHVVNRTTIHSLPSPGDLTRCAESGLRSCGVGFRAPYLLEAARMVSGGAVDLNAVADMPCDDARDLLKTIPGVGDKIADCVLLFAFSRYETFPVDVWIKRAMQAVYFDSRDVKPGEIRQFGQRYFGRFAGYAQEYIYYYARTHRLV